MNRTASVCFVLAVSGTLAAEPVAADPGAAASFVAVPRHGSARFEPSAAEHAVPEPFRLPPATFAFETEFERASGPVRIFKVRFPSPVATEVAENNTVHAHYFQPRGEGPFPAVVVLHILGGDFPLSQAIANGFARRGIAALFVKMPYYGERRGPDSPRRMLSREPRETVAGMTQGVLDVRHAAAWLAARPEVDSDQLGITGISMGGIMSALAACGEPRFGKVAPYLAGGRLHEAIWENPAEEFEQVRRKWIADGGTRESFLEEMSIVDPATNAHLLKERRVLMVNARQDELIPPECTVALWEAMDRRPELVWLEAGHYTAIRFLPGELERLARFFGPDAEATGG